MVVHVHIPPRPIFEVWKYLLGTAPVLEKLYITVLGNSQQSGPTSYLGKYAASCQSDTIESPPNVENAQLASLIRLVY